MGISLERQRDSGCLNTAQRGNPKITGKDCSPALQDKLSGKKTSLVEQRVFGDISGKRIYDHLKKTQAISEEYKEYVKEKLGRN